MRTTLLNSLRAAQRASRAGSTGLAATSRRRPATRQPTMKNVFTTRLPSQFSYSAHFSTSAEDGEAAPLMSDETIAMIKATAGVVAEHAVQITNTFYPIMFKNNPETLAFFNKTNQVRGKQPQALANAVIAYASNIDKLGNLAGPVEVVAHKHCGLNVLPQHYHIVEENLMIAIGEVLGNAVTPEVAAAWGEATGALSKILYTREEELYAEAEARQGGWRGWKDFTVSEKAEIADGTFLFKLAPPQAEAGTSFQFTPGQFLSVQCTLGGGNPRHYHVVSAPGDDHLAFAVKRQGAPADVPDAPDGIVSSHLIDNVAAGDTLQITPPFGMSKLPADAAKDAPLLAFTGGVGVTALQGILRQALAEGYTNVLSVHQDHDPASVAFADVLGSAHHSFTRFSQQDSEWLPAGLVTGDDLSAALASAGAAAADTTVLMCAPVPLMQDASAALKEMGVKSIHATVMGPQLSSGLSQ